MKYWKNNDIEYIDYVEGNRVLPTGKPAAIVTNETTRIEIEIVPGTDSWREYVDPITYTLVEGLCVEIEYRKWCDGYGPMYQTIVVPLESLGYETVPYNYSAFDDAMKII